MQEITVQVLSVESKNTSKGAIYEVAMSDGIKYATFDGNLAAVANGFQGQVVTARVDVQQKGKYTNYYLNEIGLPGTLAPAAQPVVPGAVLPAPAAAPVPVALPAPQVFTGDVKEKLIARENVLRTAFDFVGSLYSGAGPEALAQAKSEALELASELYKKVLASEVQATPVPITPAAVAEAVPGVQVGTDGVEQPAAPTPDW